MNKKSVIVFDFDGTIVDSNNLEHQALLNTIHEYGYEEIDDSNLEDHFGPAESGILKNILGEDIFPEAWAFFIEDYLRLQEELLVKIPGMDDLLLSLSKKKDLLLLLVTGRSKETADISLDYLGYDKYFAKTYTGSDEGINKDENIEKILDDYGVEKEHIVYVGDTLADIKIMKSIGIEIISVSYSQYDKNHKDMLEEENPHHVVHSVKELEEKLLNITK